MARETNCPVCGTPASPLALEGNCPVCLLNEMLPGLSSEPLDPTAATAASAVAYCGQYEVGEQVGRGGMGVVLSARDESIERTVAMKIALPGPPERQARFVQEARVTGRLEHPNIVPVHNLGVDAQGRPFYTMKLVKGITLHQVLMEIRDGKAETLKRFALSLLLTIFQKVCDAVAFAHAHGIIHRDLKPENVMIGDYGQVFVMDWGLAKILATGETVEEADKPPAESRSTQMPTQTLDGTVLGTPTSMAPEQAEGRIRDQDKRTDIFALGGILYGLLTLRPPVRSTTVKEMIEEISSGRILPPKAFNTERAARHGSKSIRLAHCPGGKVPEALSAVTMKAMAFTPSDRYQTVQDLQADITSYQAGFATSAEQASAWRHARLFVQRHKAVSAAVLLIALVVTGFMLKVIADQRRNERTLAELRHTSPFLIREVGQLVAKGEFAQALPRIALLGTLFPADPEYPLREGNIYQSWFLSDTNLNQSLLRLERARDAYARALEFARGHEQARTNLQVCLNLINRIHQGTLPEGADFQLLYNLMRRQGRLDESSFLRLKVRQFTNCLAAMQQAGVSPGNLSTLDLDENGYFSLFLTNELFTNISFLAGFQFNSLELSKSTNISSLAPLAGMPLTNLHLRWLPISDFTPLTNMPLVSLGLYRTGVSNLSALRGLRLQHLDLDVTSVKDLRPLQGMSLEYLLLKGTGVSNLNPLAGMPLKELNLEEAKNVSDISPLRGAPLKRLNLMATQVQDVSPLLNCTELEELFLPRKATNFIRLREHPRLKRLSYYGSINRKDTLEPSLTVNEFWPLYAR